MKVTLRDIAAKTGFSVNTVSHALTGKNDISEATRAHIATVAAEMGYIRNTTASGLRSGRSHTIAVILPDLGNPNFTIALRGIEAFFRGKGYTVFALNTDEDAAIEAAAIRTALGQSTDGIILCPAAGNTENLQFLKKAGIPFTLMGRRCEEKTDYVICDDEGGGYIATRHLLDNGHRQIAFFNVDPRISSARERLNGCRRAMQEAGCALPDHRILTLAITARSNRACMQAFLESNPDVTALVAFSDLLAYEAICTLSDLGRRVPDDLSLVGFDNICSDFALPPPLSSVSVSKKTMAACSAELLWQKINGTAPAESRIILPTTLKIRDTVKKLI